MKILIVGAGFTGLTCGITLLKLGHEVEIREKDNKSGGLAMGFEAKNWNWSLEKYYHHIFANDDLIINLADEMGQKIIWKEPETNCMLDSKQHALDSAMSLLKFEKLETKNRIRLGAGLAILKAIPNAKFLEKYRVVDVLPKLVGQMAYKTIWRPLLVAKFGDYLTQVNMAWFWARVYKRTKKLGYFEGGFQAFADKQVKYINKRGGRIKLGKDVKNLKAVLGKFDRVILTVPGPVAEKLIASVNQYLTPTSEESSTNATATIRGGILLKLNYLWGQTLILELNKSLMAGYWLNILEKNWPFLVAVEHTNLIDKKYYGNKHIVYLGNYLMDQDRRLKLSDKALLDLYLPYLKKINSKFEKKWINNLWRFQSNFAQPVFPINYSQKLPKMKLKTPNLYIANMSMVYPWDRGTNYAVELGERVAKMII